MTTKQQKGRTFQTVGEWKAEAARKFGADEMQWRFVCPACNHVAAIADWKAAGAPVGTVAFSCVGRWMESPREAFGEGPGPCNYVGGGLFGLNPVEIVDIRLRVFEFAPATEGIKQEPKS